MKRLSKLLAFQLLALSAMFSPISSASSGRIEINQVSVEAAGGFPYTISEAGSYVLTSSLTVPADTDGIILDANEVSLDLNGFSIMGPANCSPGGCPSGTGEGIRLNVLFTHANRSAIGNGLIEGFANNCLRFGSFVRVHDLIVRECGEFGIIVGIGGIVTGNTVNRTGKSGINMNGRSVYSHNTVSEHGLGGGGEAAIQGGKATAGNYCDDGSCGNADARKGYYLSPTTFTGSETLTACEAGYHMASIWELINFSQLRYYVSLGESADDSGEGPPVDIFGWVRTGSESSISLTPGLGNCEIWSSERSDNGGTMVRLPKNWLMPVHSLTPWHTAFDFCDQGHKVWCFED